MVNLRKYYLITFQILFTLLFFINCSSNNQDTVVDETTDTKIYKKGLSLLNNGNYKQAASEFDKLFLNFPFSTLASSAEVMTAYSLFENNDIKKAVQKLEEFIELNPSGNLSEYAQYLLAMCYYIQISDEGRDPNLSEKALEYFKIITTKYPNGKYAKDAKIKIQYINTALAQNELMIGIYYLKNNSPASSIKRFRSIIKNYQNTAVIPETLYRLSEALLMIGLKQEATKSSSLLEYNFPKNKWAILSKKLLNNDLKQKDSEGYISSIKNYITNLID